jgi:peptide/nickel transport system ATP-binding protein
MDICRSENPALTTLVGEHRVACFAASPQVKPTVELRPLAHETAQAAQ